MRPIKYDNIDAMKKCIQDNMERGGEYLTLRSITEKTGVPFQTVGRYIQQFTDRGEIETDDELGYIITETSHKIRRFGNVPIVGTISCGALDIAEQRSGGMKEMIDNEMLMRKEKREREYKKEEPIIEKSRECYPRYDEPIYRPTPKKSRDDWDR